MERRGFLRLAAGMLAGVAAGAVGAAAGNAAGPPSVGIDPATPGGDLSVVCNCWVDGGYLHVRSVNLATGVTRCVVDPVG